MTEQRRETDLPLNPPEPEGIDKVNELMGQRRQQDQSAVVDYSELDSSARATPTKLYEGEPGDSLENEGYGDESLEQLTDLELRADETDDPMEAVEEGYTYIPPIDPPIAPSPDGSYENAEVASGFGSSSLDDEYSVDGHGDFLPADDEVSARVREALLADSSTSGYAHRISIAARGGRVLLRGAVDDLVDSDNLVAVASYVEGVEEVIDDLDVRGM